VSLALTMPALPMAMEGVHVAPADVRRRSDGLQRHPKEMPRRCLLL